MNQNLIDLFKSFENLHIVSYSGTRDFTRDVKATDETEHLADIAFAMREIINRLDDIKKELSTVQQLAIKKACLLWIKHCASEPIRTEYCTATPKVVKMPILPKKGSEEYENLLAHYGFSSEDMGMFKPHWPDVQAHFEQLAKEGKPFPPGTDFKKSYPTYKMDIRKKKDIA